MADVFADTFFYLALLNEKDAAHERAFRVAQAVNSDFVTSTWVLTELADGLATTRKRDLVAPFIDSLQSDPAVRVIPAGQLLFDRGLELYRSRPDKAWSLTDCISFVVMQDHGLSDALTGDHHFEQAGFVALLKS